MGQLKNYLLRLQEAISEHHFGQDAVVHAITTGQICLTYDFDTDVRTIAQAYDVICETYQTYLQLQPLSGSEPEFSLRHETHHLSRPPDQWRSARQSAA